VIRATLLLALLLVAAPAHALKIQNATPAQEATIEAQWEKLSPCIQDKIIAQGLTTIKILPHGKLGHYDVANDEPEACLEKGEVKTPKTTLYIHAQSLMYKGKIVIDTKSVTPEVVMHEFGHWFGDNVVEHGYYHAWRDALEKDLKDLEQCERYDSEYLRSPYEAEAEIFAGQFIPADQMHMYSVTDFKRTDAMMAEILTKTCPVH
jgi:hypothetical protein